MLRELEDCGFVFVPGAVSDAALGRLLAACVPATETQQLVHPAGATYGIRGLLWSSRRLNVELEASGVSALARILLGPTALPIDAIFFDKQQCANWSVPGHQDRIMPVEAAGALPVKVRGGIAYAEPSPATLAGLLALRVHFDPAESQDGPIEVVPGTHRNGVMDADAIRAVPLSAYHPCSAARGDVLALRPLLLHRSGRRVTRGHRRVLHVVYAVESGTDGVRWRSD